MHYKLIEKYIQGKASEDEIRAIIEATLESPKFKAELMERIKINALTSDANIDVEVAWSGFQQNKINRINKKKYQFFLKIAAVLIVGLFIGSFFFNSNDKQNIENEIVLELSNGTKKIISSGENLKIVNAKGTIVGEQIDNRIVFSDNNDKNGEVQYNTLFVPYGKKFQIEFSDGSLAYLNSGTSIKFPVQFKKGNARKVYLDGEAYFNITEDKEHSFIVSTNTIDTKVYGTKFNVLSYKSDNKNEIVLVEGKVGVYKSNLGSEGNMTYLKPNQMAFLNSYSSKITINNINPKNYTSWIKGELVFNDLPFSDIIRKLERHYNVIITNNYIELNTVHFTGSFDTETIDQVLKSFSNYRVFKYEINNNQININSNN
ncbi:MAG: FecR family protein [Flavobacteriaceae bacterium]|nr:FecR family protein [Flavobacteriaceae bacterium]